MKTTPIILFFGFLAVLYFFGWRDNSNTACPSSKGRILQSTGDITFPSSSFIIKDHFNVYFDIDSTDITMLIQCTRPNRYFAIGFGSSGMAGSDIWAFTISGGQIHASDRYGAGYFTPPTDTSNGGTDDLTLLGFEITSSYSLVKVRRPLNTGDSNDFTINEGDIDLIYASGPSGSIVNHGPTRGHVLAPLRNGVSGLVLEDDSSFSKIDLHGIFNIIAWGVLVDIAILVARYLRGTKFTVFRVVITAQVIHSALMWLAFILSTIVTITLLTRKGMDAVTLTGEGKHDFHVVNGLIILGLSTLAVAIGGFNFYLMRAYKDTVGAKVIQNLKLAHLALGLLLYLLTKVNIIIGVIFHDSGSWKVPVFVYLGVLAAFHILFQFTYSHLLKCPKRISNSAKPRIQNQSHVDLLEAINNGIPMEKILTDFPKTKWVQVGNGIYDLTDWVHPGGNFIIEACIGREVGRFLYGNYALEGVTIKPHKHSQLALSQIQKFYIGDITTSESILVHKNTKEEAQALAHHTWKIVSFKPISDTVSQINFLSQDFNVKAFGSSLSSLSRHFKVSFNRKGCVARQYTTALALTEANTQLREDAYKYFTNIMTSATHNGDFNNHKSFQSLTDSLPLFIKSYSFPKALSKALHNVNIDGSENDIIVEGPIGRGLELTEDSTGTHTVICAGTGLLPFVDFLHVFLFKIMYEAIKEKAGKEKAKKINVYNLPFDKIMRGMKVNFFGAFANKKEVIGLDIIEKLAEINNKYKIDCFSAVMKGYSDENIIQTKEYFSADFFKKHLTLTEEKYYIVGPPKLNAQVSQDLAKLGVARNKIILV